MGWRVEGEENAIFASELMTMICLKEDVLPGKLSLHSDNGSPMKGATMLATLQSLGVAASFSRPRVSNDNPFSESLFRTMKCRPSYPENPFQNLNAAQDWVNGFVAWYNTEHLHSGVRFVTPQSRHSGEEHAILAHRACVYRQAKEANPDRWTGRCRNWTPVKEVVLNGERSSVEWMRPTRQAA